MPVTTITTAATEDASRFRYVTPNDVYASLVGGGSISVEEWPRGDLRAMAPNLERTESGVLILEVADDTEGVPMDRVSIHPDEGHRLALIEKGIRALENARVALKAVGYVDGVG
jgi:hypothetical protein